MGWISLCLSLSPWCTYTHVGPRTINNLHLLALIKTDQWMRRPKVNNQLITASLLGEIHLSCSEDIFRALDVQTEKCENWKWGETIFPALTATVLRLTAADPPAVTGGTLSLGEISLLVGGNLSVCPCCAVRFIWTRKCRAHWGTVKRTDGCCLLARIGTG